MKKQSIQELNLIENQTLGAVRQNEIGTSTRKTPYLNRRHYDGGSSSFRSVRPVLRVLKIWPKLFMSNTPPIQRYFLEERYCAENPLGNQPEIAKCLKHRLKALWGLANTMHSLPEIQVGRIFQNTSNMIRSNYPPQG
ncbi:hypothetical protein OUZ56_030309 [Daphnia magna]|uniref:Uncharacterized protein n=1 Tax=Daphnia magna TaxID=35525 RepID=A0ABQ9ZQY8_9CRUS|nr:hypothetical protein OUZ56_030309 [Daphnia magna]